MIPDAKIGGSKNPNAGLVFTGVSPDLIHLMKWESLSICSYLTKLSMIDQQLLTFIHKCLCLGLATFVNLQSSFNLIFFRRLSLRPSPEELEQRNILKCKCL